jgi:hypothetical protein
MREHTEHTRKAYHTAVAEGRTPADDANPAKRTRRAKR